ncbi:hypothetical protein [Haladaptatus sp. DFWS20]|uniref:hypothetical protein n=1 Tax=Haladaptatus sp. DFWS20 TaxID=3403467 RepID=UPI003EC0951F
MTTEMGALLGKLGLGIVGSLLATGIISIVGFLFRSRVINFVRRTGHYLTDTTVFVELSRRDRYDSEPTSDIDMHLFEEISEFSNAVEFDALNGNRLRVRGESIPTPLEIRIEHMPNFDSHTADRHEVVVETFTDMAFGYRKNKPLTEFESLSREISRIVQRECFGNADPKQTFLTGKVKGKLPADQDEINDDEMKMRAKINDGWTTLRFENPDFLKQGLEKYFRPL